MTDRTALGLAACAVSAQALAGLLQDLSTALSTATATAEPVARSARQISRALAPRVTDMADVGEIGRLLALGVRDLARAANPADASAVLYRTAAQAREAYPRTASPVLTRAYRAAQALATGMEVACLGEAFLAEARSAFADRPSGDRARARIAAAMDDAGDRIAGLLGQEVYGALNAVALETGTYLAQRLASLTPVVRVKAGRSLPSTALAWALYGDPARGAELVARNNAGCPLFMGPEIEALSPNS